MTTAPHSAPRPDLPLPRGEFVVMMAAIMAINALAIDSMLPALAAIGADLGVARANSLQLIIAGYLFANAVGSLFAGPLADRFGRRPVLLGSMAICLLCALASGVAASFGFLVAVRILHGFISAALAVLAMSIVRDRYSGDTMARLVSTISIIFMIVPVIAPTLGQVVLAIASWRTIFHVLAGGTGLVLIWVLLRLPETMLPANRQRINPASIARNWRRVATDRTGAGYAVAAGIALGGLFGFLTSSPQIFADVFRAPDLFPVAFAVVAGTMAVANYFNSRIVERFGARRVSHSALIAYILFGAGQLILSWTTGGGPMLLFLALVALNMGMVGFTGANFSAIAMEPFGDIAGTASSFQNFVRMGLGALIGGMTGQRFDGTIEPLAEGFLVCGLLSMGCVLWAERGRLFTRPRRAKLEDAAVPR